MDFKILANYALLATFVSTVAGTLILKPRDTDVKVNQSTYFNCSTDLSTAIFWKHGDNLVYTVQGILELYQKRFEIDRSEWNGTYIYNLIIHSVQPSDAGQYICADDEGVGEKYSVQLVVLDGDPICRSNIELDEVIGQNTCNVEPDEVELSCSVTYHGNSPPLLTWGKDGDDRRISDGLSNVISGKYYNYILKLKGDISLDKSVYVCQTARMTQEPRKCISEVINVLYALSDNSTVNGSIDDEILCYANTTQSCKYKWRWFDDNDVTTESSSAVLKTRKPGLHKCEAECYLRNETCKLLVMRVFVMPVFVTPALVYENTDSSQTMNAGISVAVVVAVVVTLIVALIILLVVFRHRIAEKWTKDVPADMVTTEDQELLDVIDVPADMVTTVTEDQELLEIHVIEFNYQFLVENLKGSHLIDLLHEQNCITNEIFLPSNHTDNYVNNEALLKWMGDIAFKKENGRTILECLRKSEQNLIADLLGKVGGVFIKSMITTKLLVETQLLTETIEAFKEKKMMVIEKLNNPQGLSLGVELSSVPDIVIAPYCRLEANEIVIWFWCQSKNGQINLKNIYDSKTLHQELTTLFKEFVNDSVSSESEILVPSTISLGDFTKKDTIHGLAVLNQEAFIARQLYPYIEVYDSRTFQFRRRIEVDGMNNPENVVSCSVNNCLYTFDWQYEDQNHAILKIDPNNGKLFKTWLIEGRGGRLSVASDTHVILNKSLEAKLLEYTSDGEFIRTVDLVPMFTGIDGAQHAVKLNNDQFLVCHGGVDDPLSRVCLVSLARPHGLERTYKVERIVNSFGAEQGKSMNRLMGPTYLSVNKEGSILVSYASHQFVLLTCNLDEPQIIVSEEHGLEKSWRTCFDESTGQWFLADYKRVMVCRVTDKQVERKLYYLTSPVV